MFPSGVVVCVLLSLDLSSIESLHVSASSRSLQNVSTSPSLPFAIDSLATRPLPLPVSHILSPGHTGAPTLTQQRPVHGLLPDAAQDGGRRLGPRRLQRRRGVLRPPGPTLAWQVVRPTRERSWTRRCVLDTWIASTAQVRSSLLWLPSFSPVFPFSFYSSTLY